jgi:hypothetical protein
VISEDGIWGGRKAAMVCQLPISYNGILRINTVRGLKKLQAFWNLTWFDASQFRAFARVPFSALLIVTQTPI